MAFKEAIPEFSENLSLNYIHTFTTFPHQKKIPFQFAEVFSTKNLDLLHH